jgi:hypothetical protein
MADLMFLILIAALYGLTHGLVHALARLRAAS